MGIVYKAHDPEIDRLVALKILRQDRVVSEEFLQRFLVEAKAIGRLSHKNIVTVYDVGKDNETIYIAMEYLEGRSFNDVMKENRMSINSFVDIGAQIAETLNYAHEKGIVHRDIKPSNIILTSDGQVKLTDFGIARIEDPDECRQTRAGEILGTPLYMSPEQVNCQEVDGRSDLYSLGVILYELTTGKKPFRGDNIAVVFREITQETPVRPVARNSSISQALSELIMKSLRKEPGERFQNGKEMAAALKLCVGKEATGVLPEKTAEARANLIPYITIIVLIVSSIAGIIYYYPHIDNLLKRADQTAGGSASSKRDSLAEQVIDRSVLKVESMPTGAQVFLDDSFKGKTPIMLELPFGKYEVRLSRRDFHEWEAQIHLDKTGEMPLYVRLVPMVVDGRYK